MSATNISPLSVHSSREPSAALSEWERKARAETQKLQEILSRKQLLQEQQTAIEEEARLAEESLRSYESQARSERKNAAMVDQLDQIIAEKQEQFRAKMADEVYTRLARSLLKNDEATLSSVQAIADKSYGPSDLTVFKACFFDALSGDDKDFLSNCAVRTLEIFEKGFVIDEKTISAVESSEICFDGSLATSESPSNDSAIDTTIEPIEKVENLEALMPVEQEVGDSASESNGIIKVIEEDRRSPTPAGEIATAAELETPKLSELSMQAKDKVKSEDIIVKVIVKEEDNHGEADKKRGRRTTMRQLDEETVASRSRQASTAGLSTFSIGNGRNSPAVTSVDVDQSDEELSLTAKETAPASKKRKMEHEDISDGEEVTVSPASEPAKRKKKPKMSPKTPTTSVAALIRFRNHIENQASAQKLTQAAFACSKCGKDVCTVDKPRITKNCQHLYCNKCTMNVRAQHKKTSKGTPDKARCVHKGCSSTTGPMAILSNKDIRKIKTDNEDKIYEDEDDDDEGELLAEKTDEEASDSEIEAGSED